MYRGLGGSGGGAVEIVGHHVLLDGSIRVDGNSVDDRHSENAGKTIKTHILVQ